MSGRRVMVAWSPCRALPLLTIALLAGAPASGAPPTTARLVVERSRGAEQCPDEAALQRAVAARLGRDPFRPDAGLLIRVRLDRQRGGMAAALDVTTSGGARGSRTLTSRDASCGELAAAVALALSIIIDPLARPASQPGWDGPEPPELSPPPAPPFGPASPPSPEPKPVAAAPAAAPTPVVAAAWPTRERGSGIVPELSVGGAAAFGAAPTTTGSVLLQAGLRRGALSVALEGRFDVPVSTSAGSGSVSAGLLMGDVVPCYHRWLLAGCAVFGAGVLRGSGHNLAGARSETSAVGVAGARLIFEWPLGARFGLRAYAEVLGRLRSVSLRVDDASVWTTPPVSGGLGLALAVKFPR
jgi:hypothetical protein